jgi:hypothetical protein
MAVAARQSLRRLASTARPAPGMREVERTDSFQNASQDETRVEIVGASNPPDEAAPEALFHASIRDLTWAARSESATCSPTEKD